jgi:hypothetical protein
MVFNRSSQRGLEPIPAPRVLDELGNSHAEQLAIKHRHVARLLEDDTDHVERHVTLFEPELHHMESVAGYSIAMVRNLLYV